MAAAIVSNRIFIGNIPEGTSDDALKAMFAGTVTEVTRADRGRPFAWMSFSTDAEAEDAVATGAGDLRLEMATPPRDPVETTVQPLNVYVGNLPREYDEERLTALFAEFGEITSTRFIPRGFGYVSFATEGEAQAALVRDGAEVGGRTIRVEIEQRAAKRARKPRAARAMDDREPAEPRAGHPCRIFVGDLSAATTEEDVRAAVGAFGTLERVKLVTAREDNIHAYVTFETADAAAAAVASNGALQVAGVVARVEMEKARPKRRRAKPDGAAGGGGGGGRGERSERPAVSAEPNPAEVWVGNLPAESERDAIIEAFEKYGEIVRVTKRKGRQFAYVLFGSVDAADEAIADSGNTTVAGEAEGPTNVQKSTSAKRPRRRRTGRAAAE